MTTDFSAAIRTLLSAEVKFVVVGAFAARLHGGGVSTDDLDICYQRSKENMQRLATVLATLKPSLRGAEGVPFILDARTISNGMNFTFVTTLGDIDILGSLSGVGSYEDLIQDAEEIEFDGMSCRVASLRAVIKSKKAAGRTKDKLMLPELEAMLDIKNGPPKGSG